MLLSFVFNDNESTKKEYFMSLHPTLRACLQEERVTLYQGYLSKLVKVSSGLQANFTGRVTLTPGSTLPALLTCFVMRDIQFTTVQNLKLEILYRKNLAKLKRVGNENKWKQARK